MKGMLTMIKILGASLVFAYIGGLLGLFLGAFLLQGSSNDGFGLMSAGIMLSAIGAIGGFGFGLALFSSHQSRSVPIPFALLGYVFLLVSFVGYQVLSASRTAAVAEVTSERARVETNTASELQGFRRSAETEAPAIFGSLFFPGAVVIPDGYPDPTYPRLTLRVRAPFRTVTDYYRDVVTDIQEDRRSFRARAMRPGDGRSVRLLVVHALGSTDITFFAESTGG